MLINLSDVFSSEGKVVQRSEELSMETFDNGIKKYGVERFPIIEKSSVEFTFTNIGVNEVEVTGGTKLVIEGSCDRCLEPVAIPMELSFERVIKPLTEGMDGDEADELSFMEGYQLNVEDFVKTEIIVNWPMKILCKDDCKGVCPVCGKNLNVVTCGCDTFVPDPRMAVIQDIFNANKEV